jgi:predicted DNA-binding transcriptional regulator AlpA
MNDSRVLSEREVHTQYGFSIPWLRKRRRLGDGPPYLKIGALVRYRREDIDQFLRSHVVNVK